MMSSSLNELEELLMQTISSNTLYSAVLSSPIAGHPVQKITVRQIQTKQISGYQITEQKGPKAIHRNISPAELTTYLLKEATCHFKQAIFNCEDADYHFLRSSKGKTTLLKKKPTKSKALPLKFSVPLNKLAPGKYTCQVSVLDPTARKFAFWRALVVVVP